MLNLFKKKQPPGRPMASNAILVPEAAVAQSAEDYALTMAVVNYVNRMQSQCLYRRDEIPQEAMWIYHCDYYLAQVNNGGHSQFIGNSGLSEFLKSDIRNGLGLVGAEDMAQCFNDMMHWVGANASEAALQNGFGERAKELDELDTRFFALSEDKFYPKVNAWLHKSGLLKPLAADALDAAFENEARWNPDRVKRARIQIINRMQHMLTADYLGVFQVAAANKLIGDNVFEVQQLTAGTFIGHPTDKNGVIWGVATSTGVLAGYLTKDSVVLAEAGQERGFSAGKTLFECPRSPAEDVVCFSKEMLAAGCAVELLGLVNREAEMRFIGPAMHALGQDKKGRRHMVYIASTNRNQNYQIVLTETHAAIGPLNFEEPMRTIGKKDIARLKTEIEAHNTYVPTR